MMMVCTQVSVVVLLLLGRVHARGIANKIYKGPRAKVNEDPFSVYLGYNSSQVCGGSLVHEDFVLTLMDCVRGRDSSLLKVTAGHRRLYTTEGETVHNVSEIIEYSGNTNSSVDVVLLRLSPSVDTSGDRIGTTSLSNTVPSTSDTCVLSAYGDTGRQRPFKQSLDVTVVPESDQCDGFVSGISRCYEPVKRRRKACEGDQGSPVTCEYDNTAVQVGINLASSCADRELAARTVDDVIAWVVSVTDEDHCESNPCLNSGTCQDNIGNYTCNCTTGWTGLTCDTVLCPPDWDQVGTSCYYIDTTLQSWTSAQATCSVSGGHLLDINTETENKEVINLFITKQPGTSKQVWIGGQDVDSNEIFYWTDGSLVSDGFEFWFDGEPDNWGAGEDCMLLRTYRDFTWNDGGCASTFWSICEKEL